MDAASWMHTANGSVDLGLSPVLSHESQSAHTLNSFSEPDVPFLPPGLDLSFIGENNWQTAGHVAYPGSNCAPQDFSSTMVASPQHVPYGVANGQHGYGVQSHVACGPQQQPVFFQDAHDAHPRSSDAYQPVAHGRLLLPRADVYPFQGVPSNGGYVALQNGNAEPHGRVSSAPGMPRDPMMPRPASTRSAGYMDSMSQAAAFSPVGQMPTPRSDAVPHSFAGSVNEDFSSFIQYDQEDKVPVAANRLDCSIQSTIEFITNELFSYTQGYGPVHTRSDLTTPEQDAPFRRPATSSAGPSIPGEIDEGRYRNHPLYSEGPHADGLYHCPFKGDPSCQHKATKLKCNYEYDLHPDIRRLQY